MQLCDIIPISMEKEWNKNSRVKNQFHSKITRMIVELNYANEKSTWKNPKITSMCSDEFAMDTTDTARVALQTAILLPMQSKQSS